MTDQEDNINLGKSVFDDNNQESKSWACLGQTCSRALIVFMSQPFCYFVDHLWMLLENSPLKDLWRINCLGRNFVQCGRIRFTITKAMKKLISTKNRVFISLVGPSETGKWQFIYNWHKIGTFQPKFDKIYFFYQHSQPLYDVMQKWNWKSRVWARSKLLVYWFVIKQRHKKLVSIWRLLWWDLHFKIFCWHCHRWETSGSQHNLH